MTGLGGKTILVGVSGGIAAYKACDVVSRLKKSGAEVFVIMTAGACEFVRPLSLKTLSQNPVALDTFDMDNPREVTHIALAKKAHLFLVAPASADIIAKLALGLADDMLSTTALACKAPLLLAPAMNTVMWFHPATQENVNRLIARGAKTVGPDGGLLACGDVGAGRMSDPADIVAACEAILSKTQDMRDLRVLVTAGPTREKIDPVRYITNRSSGKMGYAIAEAALARGAKVTLVSGPVNLPPVAGAEMLSVISTHDLFEAVMSRASEVDMLIQAAAPADFTPVRALDDKIKKQADSGLRLDLAQTRDVARAAGQLKKPNQVFVGFAAETGEGTASALNKLAEKNLDLIALNDVTAPGAGFDVDTNVLTLITAKGQEELPLLLKRQAAERLLDKALELLHRKVHA